MQTQMRRNLPDAISVLLYRPGHYCSSFPHIRSRIMAEPMVAFIHKGQDLEEGFSILVVCEYGFLIVAPIGDVIDSSGVFNAKGTGHGGSLSED